MSSQHLASGTARVDVAVLGGGLAGLAAALAFGRMGRRVVLLERDPPMEAGDADTLFERWDRAGIPHSVIRTTSSPSPVAFCWRRLRTSSARLSDSGQWDQLR
jgi:glycine/D-amino acid oxidase-like deaminating enzyme